MPVTQLMELARAGDLEAFEARCLDLLESGQLALAQLAGPFAQFERDGRADRLGTLAMMILENAGATGDPGAALVLARIALAADAQNKGLRQRTIELYRQAYGSLPHFDLVLNASGLSGGRPVRMALNVLDLGLTLAPGDTLICRHDDRVVEVAEIDRQNGLFTLRREGRTTTMPAAEVARDYERIAADDFRVLRQLRPERLVALIQDDPVAVIVGLIHARGGMIDVDLLKHELVPKYVESKEWSRWWSRTRTALKKCPNVVIEGRSPVILRYTAEAQTLEDETWAAFEAQKGPAEWLDVVEGYLREKVARKETPNAELLWRFHDFLVQRVASEGVRRPAEALACALTVTRLAGKGLPTTDETRVLAETLMRQARDPGALLAALQDETLRLQGWRVLRTARPDDWARFAVAALPAAAAGLLDELAVGVLEAGQGDELQRFIDAGLSDLPDRPELMYWLWREPSCSERLRLPGELELFRQILDTLDTLGRSVSAEPAVVKEFRQRARTALSWRDYEKVRRCLSAVAGEAAITIRRQMERLEGMGPILRSKLLDALREAHPQLWAARPRAVQPWEDTETIWATAEGLARRTAERDDIVNVKMRDNAKRIGEAASHGDLSENSEYKFALEERDLLRARVAKLNDELSRARVLEPHQVPSDSVGIGTRVTLRRLDDGTERVMVFCGPFETDVERGVYSYLAPVSQKLMGSRVGDRLTVSLGGQEVTVEVAGITSALGGG